MEVVQHHPIFSRFKPYGDRLPGYYECDFLGTRLVHQFVGGRTPQDGINATRYPQPDEEYFEWIDLLESVVAARQTYSMIDLGAGYGRWCVRAAFAAQQFNPGLVQHLIAVEGEPMVASWMRQHFIDNGVDITHHRLIHGAVSESQVPGG